MESTSAFLIVFSIAVSVSLLMTPIGIMLGSRFNVMDNPGGRRRGHGAVSRLGGIAIFSGFVIAIIVAQFLPVPRFDPNEVIRFTGLVIGVVFVFVMGILDDIFEFGAIPQFLVQITAAVIAVCFLIFIETINNPFTGEQIAWPFSVTVLVSVFWLILMMNTVNFLDGLDGLAGGVSMIAGVILFINSAFRLIPAQTSVSLLPLALIGACIGFLVFNFYPARIFMGSSGSYVLGYVLGVLSIIGGAKMATILLVMGLPLLDVGWQILDRLSRGKNPMRGDRGHIHFRLIDMNVGHRKIVLVYYLFCTIFGTLTLVTNSRIFKFAALITMILLVSISFYILKKLEARAR